MTFDEAMSAAVLGDRVRCDDMQPGSYVDYQFNGWRRCFESGSHSGFTPTDRDRTGEWSIVPIVPERDKWGRVVGEPSPIVTPTEFGKWGRRA